MNRLPKEVEIIGQLADMKEMDYKNMLLLNALIDLLINKGLISQKELLDQAYQLETDVMLD